MDYQFLEDFKKLSVACPPKHYKPKKMTVYRWVFDDIEAEQNFIPVFYTNPKKYFGKTDIEKCRGLALSLFATQADAEERFYDLQDGMGRKAYKVLGTHIATGDIDEQDGVNEEPNASGHFNHHPVKGHQYEKRFNIISKL
ncbi:MAG: hypothetical protein RIS64_291 [Bacteroidota bacterium]|jgi:hypothetical protein